MPTFHLFICYLQNHPFYFNSSATIFCLSPLLNFPLLYVGLLRFHLSLSPIYLFFYFNLFSLVSSPAISLFFNFLENLHPLERHPMYFVWIQQHCNSSDTLLLHLVIGSLRIEDWEQLSRWSEQLRKTWESSWGKAGNSAIEAEKPPGADSYIYVYIWMEDTSEWS